jgi:hypothetical protein
MVYRNKFDECFTPSVHCVPCDFENLVFFRLQVNIGDGNYELLGPLKDLGILGPLTGPFDRARYPWSSN